MWRTKRLAFDVAGALKSLLREAESDRVSHSVWKVDSGRAMWIYG